MKRLALLLLLLPSASLAAQQFEGTLTVRSGGPGGTGAMITKLTMKGQKILNVITLPGVGQEMRTITDNRAGTLTTLRPVPPGMPLPAGIANAKGVITVAQLTKAPKMSGRTPPRSDTRKLGTTQTIAGLRCTDYEVTSENGQALRMCLTASLGAMPGNPAGSGGPDWSPAVDGKRMMPLKIWVPDGATLLEVVEVKRELVSPRVFDIPPGYIDLQTALKNRTTTPKP